MATTEAPTLSPAPPGVATMRAAVVDDFTKPLVMKEVPKRRVA